MEALFNNLPGLAMIYCLSMEVFLKELAKRAQRTFKRSPMSGGRRRNGSFSDFELKRSIPAKRAAGLVVDHPGLEEILLLF